jgi:hypothetical protein
MVWAVGLMKWRPWSSIAIVKRDVMNGLVFVLYHETMFIGNLFTPSDRKSLYCIFHI